MHFHILSGTEDQGHNRECHFLVYLHYQHESYVLLCRWFALFSRAFSSVLLSNRIGLLWIGLLQVALSVATASQVAGSILKFCFVHMFVSEYIHK